MEGADERLALGRLLLIEELRCALNFRVVSMLERGASTLRRHGPKKALTAIECLVGAPLG